MQQRISTSTKVAGEAGQVQVIKGTVEVTFLNDDGVELFISIQSGYWVQPQDGVAFPLSDCASDADAQERAETLDKQSLQAQKEPGVATSMRRQPRVG